MPEETDRKKPSLAGDNAGEAALHRAPATDAPSVENEQPEWLQRRLEASRGKLRHAEKIKKLGTFVRKRGRVVIYVIFFFAAAYIFFGFKITTPKNAPAQPGLDWGESRRILVYRFNHKVSRLNRFDIVFYEYRDKRGLPVRSPGLVIGVPGDVISFRAADVKFENPADRSRISLYYPLINGRQVRGDETERFRMLLTGKLPEFSVTVQPGNIFVLNTGPGGDKVDARSLPEHQLPEEYIIGRVVSTLP